MQARILKKHVAYIGSFWFFLFFFLSCSEKDTLYKDTSQTVDVRVKNLLKQMTIQEKIAQVSSLTGDKFIMPRGKINSKFIDSTFAKGIGEITGISLVETKNPSRPKDMARIANEIQRFLREKTRLGIPVIFADEGLHSLMANETTCFPQAIALASTWDTSLVRKVFEIVAAEARACGEQHLLAPVVDVAREPRWGRVEETYGEDPYLVSRIGMAAVVGLQGKDGKMDNRHVIANLKAFAGHAQPEAGTNIAPVVTGERTMRETFLFPFKECVQKAKAGSIMSSYNEIEGIPSHANKWLLKEILRKEWGFTGFVVSDFYGVNELMTRHKIAGNKADAAMLAISAGVDIELPYSPCFSKLDSLVANGLMAQSILDTAVARILRAKFQLGLFDKPYIDSDYAEKFVANENHVAFAKKVASESVILLKNQNSLAPLSLEKYKNIAVIGPNADKALIGGYSAAPKKVVTVLEGIKNFVGTQANVLYGEGCRITTAGSWWQDPVPLPDLEEEKILISQAVKVAKKSDLVLLVVGQNEVICREAWSESHVGDRANLDLVGMQNQLTKEIVETGKPVIVLLLNGAPLSINYIKEKVPVIFEGWYMGEEGGNAFAEILFGKVNPSGKLPITFPRSVGQVPCYYNMKPTSKREYIFEDKTPLFAFGEGLSYTTFQYDTIYLEKPSIKNYESVKAFVKLTNTGEFAGSEVIQLYIRDKISSVTRPVLELKDFAKVRLSPGETKTIEFSITPEKLSFYNLEMKFVVEPGEFIVYAGGSSKMGDLKQAILTVLN